VELVLAAGSEVEARRVLREVRVRGGVVKEVEVRKPKQETIIKWQKN